MASHPRIIAATMAFVAIAAACGISAVGESTAVRGTNDDGGPSSGSSSGNAASSTSSSGGIDGDGGDDAGDGGVDASGDAAVDAPSDAPVDVGAPCPAACTGGCDGGCIINGGANPTCPPGVARCEVSCTQQSDCEKVSCGDAGVCRVTCNGPSVCNADSIECGTSACQIRCVGKDACNSTTFGAENAASLCIFCNGDPGCNSITCSPPLTCTRQFTGGANNNVGGCMMCATGSCP